MDDNKIKVLYIDDEEQNLTGFYASFRKIFEIKTALSAAAAREILKEDWFHVILADNRMPGETGVEFLTDYVRVNPKPIRILITAQTDVKTVIEAINGGQVFKYIEKPIDSQSLEFSIKEAYQLYNTREKLEIKNKELEKANMELDKFIYSASHDLRAPILSILGLVKLGYQDLPNIEKYLQMIEKSGLKLDAFILNLIHYYKNAKLDVYPKLTNLAELAKETFENVLYFDGANTIQFEVIEKGDKKEIITDKTKLSIIFNNLITNAIRYRDKEKEIKKLSITVEVEGDNAIVRIKDNGIGIESENIQKIFTMFYKASKHSQGSGIGMYIVKDAIEKLGGKITVLSELGVGTEFIIELPGLSIETPSN